MRTPFDDLVDDLKWELGKRPAAKAAWTAFAILVLLIFALAMALHFIARAAYAQPIRLAQASGAAAIPAQAAPRVIFDCAQFGGYARRIAMLREIGADRDKVINELRADLRPGLMLAVLEREVKRIYQAKPTRIQAEGDAYQRCQQQLGDMGADG